MFVVALGSHKVEWNENGFQACHGKIGSEEDLRQVVDNIAEPAGDFNPQLVTVWDLPPTAPPEESIGGRPISHVRALGGYAAKSSQI